jgi:hypothetical protein
MATGATSPAPLLDLTKPIVRPRTNVPMNLTVGWRLSNEGDTSFASRWAGSTELFVCESRSASMMSTRVGGAMRRGGSPPRLARNSRWIRIALRRSQGSGDGRHEVADRLEHDVGVGEHRDVAARDFVRGGAHALGGEPL